MVSPPVAANVGDAPPRQSRIYEIIVTPFMVVSFILSLAWVNFRYTTLRTHTHDDETHDRLPRWLHQIIYREQPYQYVRVDADKGGSSSSGGGHSRQAEKRTGERKGWFYHTKQKKLMKMEVEDAFAIRNTVLITLGLLVAVVAWLVWLLGSWVVTGYNSRN